MIHIPFFLLPILFVVLFLLYCLAYKRGMKTGYSQGFERGAAAITAKLKEQATASKLVDRSGKKLFTSK